MKKGRAMNRAALFKEAPATSYSPMAFRHSTIAAGKLNGRVRNGNGCFLPAMVTGKNAPNSDRGETGAVPWDGPGGKSKVKPHGRLVPVRSRVAALARPAYQPGSLPGAFSFLRRGRSYLGGGLALRCFQRLSFPHIATRQCPWRDNRNTIGASFPVLSY